jgi:holo-[acyl-carrier protein] synthase
MILGVGADLVAVGRIERALARSPRFASRVFHSSEMEETAGGAARLAARFAAKEAWLKAMGVPLFAAPLTDIIVACGADGRPAMRLGNKAAELSHERGVRTIHVSLSHDQGYALALVLLEGDEQ